MKKQLGSFLIVIVGIFWLLMALNILPPFAWVWSGALFAAGVYITLFEKGNRAMAVVGPFLILLSVLSVLRQFGVIGLEVELPIAVIGFGVISLVTSRGQEKSP